MIRERIIRNKGKTKRTRTQKRKKKQLFENRISIYWIANSNYYSFFDII